MPGTSGLDATTVWPLEAKKSRKVLRMSATVNVGWLMVWKACDPVRRAGRFA
ncbi:hypothetical protein D3C84_1303900 [compost metagenome]